MTKKRNIRPVKRDDRTVLSEKDSKVKKPLSPAVQPPEQSKSIQEKKAPESALPADKSMDLKPEQSQNEPSMAFEYKVVPVIILVVLIVGAWLVSRQETRSENLQKRLSAFLEILPLEARQCFQAGQYEDAVRIIDEALANNQLGADGLSWREKFEKIKDVEAINLFSTNEVVSFFRDYFVKEIAKENNPTDKAESPFRKGGNSAPKTNP